MKVKFLCIKEILFLAVVHMHFPPNGSAMLNSVRKIISHRTIFSNTGVQNCLTVLPS